MSQSRVKQWKFKSSGVKGRNTNSNFKRMVEEFKYRPAANQSPCSKECEKQEGDPALLSKWKKSAARFQPSCKNHLPAEFPGRKNKITWKQLENIHDREVLDAAEALTRLSRSATNKT